MLELTLELDKITYSSQDDIKTKVILKNSGDKPLLVNGRLALNSPDAPDEFREVSLLITNNIGDELPFSARVNIGEPKDKDFKELVSHQSIEREYSLRSVFELSKASKYSARAVYQNQADPSVGAAWKGEVTSNTVSFTVVS